MRRPSLLEGAIRKGGDPIQNKRLSIDGSHSSSSKADSYISHRTNDGSAVTRVTSNKSTVDLHMGNHNSSNSDDNMGNDHAMYMNTDRSAHDLHDHHDHHDDQGISPSVSNHSHSHHSSHSHSTHSSSHNSNNIHNNNIYQQSQRSSHNSSSTLMASNQASEPIRLLRHVDDDCKSSDYEVNLFFQLCEVTLSPPTATSRESTRWGNIRRWFIDHGSRGERYAACVQQGVFSTTPLHIVCQHPNCPLDIVVAMIEYAPETVTWEDTNGWLPLHYACAKNLSMEVLVELVRAFPDGEVAQDKRMRTPLHFAFYKSNTAGSGGGEGHGRRSSMDGGMRDSGDNDNSSGESKSAAEKDAARSKGRLQEEDVASVVHLLRRATMVGDEKGRLPLHFAAAYGTSEKALEALVEACPRSLYVKGDAGRTALHYAMANAHNDTSPSVLKCLLKHMDHACIDDGDDEGNLPLHLMSMRVDGMRVDSVIENKAQANVIGCLRIYLDAEPKLSADFLTALQSLPGWLRDDAVTHSHVKKVLNKRIAGTFPTSILLLDGYLYIMVIMCFSYASQSHINFRFAAEDLPSNIQSSINACIFGATYFLIREMVQVASMISLNTVRTWFMRFENWLDILVISMIYHYCGAMQKRSKEIDSFSTSEESANFGSEDDEHFRSGVACTIGALWFSVINFLKSTMLEFSVFYETVLYVTKNLFIFMVSLAVILIAFAQMFLIVFRMEPVCSESCRSDYGGFPHCSFNKSFLKVYTMMLGEIGEVNRYQQSLIAQILYVAFVFVVVILLSNILIAIVTDTHSVVKNERAEMVFWSNRLDFVAEMDTITAMRKKLFSRVFHSRYSEQAQGDDQDRKKKAWSETFREFWSLMINFLHEVHSDDTSLFEYYLFLLLRLLVVILVIPLWLGFGLFTAGFLWPPQVREWLFVMREVGRHDGAIANQVDNEIQTIKNRISKTNIDMMTELKRVKEDHEAMQAELKNIKTTITNEMLDIKKLSMDMMKLASKQSKAARRRDIRGNSRVSTRSSMSRKKPAVARSRVVMSRGDRSD